MYIARRLRQEANQQFFQKLHASREYFKRDISKEQDNRILGHQSVLNDFTREYNKLTASEYDYCRPIDLKNLLESKTKELEEQKLLLANFEEINEWTKSFNAGQLDEQKQ